MGLILKKFNNFTKGNSVFLNKKGFTLIELIVALAAFLILITIVSSSAVLIIQTQRKSFAMQNVGEEISYVLELMSKEIRMSEIVSDDDFRPTLKIINSDGDTVEYQFTSANYIRRRVNGGWWQSLTSSNINFNGIFYIEKFSGSPGNRAKVTIVIKATYAQGEGVPGDEVEINLQSTVSSRSFYN